MSLSDKLKAVSPRAVVWQRRPDVLCCPNIPMPMSGVAPRVILGREWWNRERMAAFTATDNHCIACGIEKWLAPEHKWLEGHELYDIDYPRGRMIYIETVPLCHYCHCFIHDGRLSALLAKKQITKKKYDAVMRHGKRVLREAGLRKPLPYVGPTAAWADWRMVLDGREYDPLYPTFEDWRKEFGV